MNPKAPLTVTQVNELVRMTLDASKMFSSIAVIGEISNLKAHFASGHLYFSVKDDDSVLKCVMFRTAASKMNFQPENGMKVILKGKLSVFPRDGQYQLYAEQMEPDGLGNRYLAFEQLKNKLASEGLFDDARKRPLPAMPKRIGVITSASGAAFHDIINVLQRRYPLGEVLLYPASVQGAEAVGSLISGVSWFSANSKFADVLIIGRGGGSFEDLCAFNDETLARAIAKCPIPVVSAVGHETDFTICDFVADRRAPTPSAAAELVSPNVEAIRESVGDYNDRMQSALILKLERLQDRVRFCSENRMLSSPMESVLEKQNQLTQKVQMFTSACGQSLDKKENELSKLTAKLEALSPLSVLSRGFSAVFDKSGKVVSDVFRLKENDLLSLRFANGVAEARVEKILGKDE